MTRTFEKSLILAATLAASLMACTSAPTRPGGTGTAGTTGTAGSGTLTGTAGSGTLTGTAGSGTPAGGAGTTGTAGSGALTGTAGSGAPTGASGNTGASGAGGGAGTAATAGASGSAGSTTDGGAGSGSTTGGAGITGGDGGAGKVPTCVTNDVAGGMNRSTNQYIECDVENQAIDFDVAASYPAPRKPGYDPSTTPVTITDGGKAFSGYQVQMCHPYCYSGNLTIGVDFVPGSDAALRGEIFFDFPATGTGLPITNAAGRASLGWIYLDGPALPAGAMVTAQMELKSKDNGLLTAMEIKKVPLKTWVEFRYFPIDSTFTKAQLTNITSIGFKLTMATAGAAEWHGVIYADHFQLRM